MSLKQNNDSEEVWLYRGVWSMILAISSAKDLFTTSWSKNVLCKKVYPRNWMSVSVSRTCGLDQSLCRTKVICYQTCIKPHGLCKTHSLHHFFLTPLGHFSCCNRHQQAGSSVFLQSDKLPELMRRFLMQEIVVLLCSLRSIAKHGHVLNEALPKWPNIKVMEARQTYSIRSTSRSDVQTPWASSLSSSGSCSANESLIKPQCSGL